MRASDRRECSECPHQTGRPEGVRRPLRTLDRSAAQKRAGVATAAETARDGLSHRRIGVDGSEGMTKQSCPNLVQMTGHFSGFRGSGRVTAGCCNSLKRWWPGTESNHRHADFQSAALPTELPGHGRQSRPGGRASEGRELDPRGLRPSRLPDQSNLNKSTQLAAYRGSIRRPLSLRVRRWAPVCLTLSKEFAIQVWRHGQSQDDQ
jgi:hypothetical protein